jgi:hypothetical protein
MQLLNDLKEMKGYWNFKEAALSLEEDMDLP